MKSPPMDYIESRRRFQKKLVLKGYSMTGLWTKKYHDQDDNENVYSMSLNYLPDTRAVLWPLNKKKDRWGAMISIAVGEDGEFPITGGTITRWNEEEWTLGSFKSMSKRIDEVRAQVRRWDESRGIALKDKAMIQLALSYFREGKSKKYVSVLLGAVRGEIEEATVSEALSIVQTRWAKSREERLRSALIWSQIFR
jgi:hypothetical protein